MRHRQSIKRKLVLIIMLTSSIALLLAGAAFVVYELISFRHAMKDNLLSMASMVGETSTAALEFNDAATAKDILLSLGQEPHIVAACLYNKEGKPVACYTRGKAQFVPLRPLRTLTRSPATTFTFQTDPAKGERCGGRFISSPILEELTQRLWKYLGIMVVVLFTSMLVALMVSSRLQRVISIPILNLAEAARRVSKYKDYSLRVNQTSEDEVGHLVAGFNGMLAQIQHRDEALQAARDGLEKRVQERTSHWNRK